jgi:hypothetical protein
METSETVTVTVTVIIINDGKPFYVSGKKYFVYKSRVYGFWMRSFPLLYKTVSQVKYFNRSIRFYPVNLGHPVLFCDEPFPCFDSYDYAYENRYFHAFFFCSSLSDAKRKYDYLTSKKIKAGYISKGHWEYLSPFITFSDTDDKCPDEIQTCTVYEKK